MTEATRTRLTLLHTNDIHSHLEETARIAGYVKQVRALTPADQMLVVDCGDFLDRARPETEGTDAAVNGKLIRSIGYDALVPGNNEGLTYTYEQLDRFYSRLKIPVVCANFRPLSPDRSIPWLTPSLTVRKAGLDIGLIGLTVPFNDYYRLLGWHAPDPFHAAEEQVRRLRNRVDVLIVLSHLGLRQDEKLAASVEGIDLILGAHTHHLLEKPLFAGRTAMSAAGKFGRHIGHLELERADGRRDGNVRIGGGCVATDDSLPDAEAEAIIEEGRSEARHRMSRVVAVLEEPLGWSPDRESPLSVLLASVVRRHTGAEIGLVNAGQFLDGLPQGPVTEETIHALCPSPINCCLMRLSGRELLQALEESLQPEFYGLEIKGFGFRGHVLGTLCCDGLEGEIDLSLPPYGRISKVTVNGEPLEPDREYTVGTLDMFTFGVGYVGLKNGREVSYLLPDFIRELLCRSLGDPALVRESRRSRMRMIGSGMPRA